MSILYLVDGPNLAAGEHPALLERKPERRSRLLFRETTRRVEMPTYIKKKWCGMISYDKYMKNFQS